MQPCCQLLVCLACKVLASAAEGILYETGYFPELGIGVLFSVKQPQVFKNLFLYAYQNSGQQLLIGDGVVLEMIGYHIVNILDKDDVGVQVIEVLNEGTVTSGTEQYGTVVIAEGGAVGSGGYRIGAGFLLGERYAVSGSVAFGKCLGTTLGQCLEQLLVLG